jgi:hypothetical protein
MRERVRERGARRTERGERSEESGARRAERGERSEETNNNMHTTRAKGRGDNERQARVGRTTGQTAGS